MRSDMLIDTDEKIEISGISYDSRMTRPGDMFIAVKGFNSDGHDYAKTAEQKGAVCIVCEHDIDSVTVPCIKVSDSRAAMARIAHRFYGNPTERFKLIGVTGTNGKTTVTYLLKAILEKAGYKVGLIGTNQNMIGDRVIEAKHTTPEAPELAKLFREMADYGCGYVVMEVSSHSLELNRVDYSRFDTGVFTNLTQDHLDFHITMENYENAKQKLFRMCKNSVINVDDPCGARFAEDFAGTALTYGIEHGAVRAENITADIGGVTFDSLSERISVAIPGKFSVYNALAAAAAAYSLGFEPRLIKAGLLEASGVKGRVELLPIKRDFAVIIDYAHTPDGLENVLKSIKEFIVGRLITVFGCGGRRDKSKRPQMGRIAEEYSDLCVVTTDNPRNESPSDIIADILKGMSEVNRRVVVENRREAIAYALNIAQKGDVVLLAGKGHETYQVLGDETIHFDEREVVNEILAEASGERSARTNGR